jgi:hypothetical protein
VGPRAGLDSAENLAPTGIQNSAQLNVILLKIDKLRKNRRRKGRTVLLIRTDVAREPTTVRHIKSKEPFGEASALCHRVHWRLSVWGTRL